MGSHFDFESKGQTISANKYMTRARQCQIANIANALWMQMQSRILNLLQLMNYLDHGNSSH